MNDEMIKRITSMLIQGLREKNLGKIIDIVKASKVVAECIHYDNFHDTTIYKIVFYIKYSLFVNINENDKEEYENIIFSIIETFYNNDQYEEQDIISRVEIRAEICQYVDWAAITPQENKTSIISKISREKDLLTKVATGLNKIQEINSLYIEEHKQLNSLLQKMCLEPVNNYNDLWDWYNDYNNRELKTYQSRRAFIKELYNPLIEVIENSEESVKQYVPYEPTGWDKLDDGIVRMKEVLINSKTTYDYQSVGMFGRELLITLAQCVYDETKCNPVDDVVIGKTDSKRMLESYINYCMKEKSNSRIKSYIKSAINFSSELTHDRTADYMSAELCYTATITTVNLIRIINKYSD